MAEPPEAVVRKFQNGLGPYIKPRDQANYIRRILALHLASHSQDGPLRRPLALPGTPHDDVAPPADAAGLHREYVDALRSNAAARRQFDEVVQTRPATPERKLTTASDGFNPLDERLAILKLQQKRQKLSIVRKYLDQLVDQPAASPTFLDMDQIFDGTSTLPSVPREVVDSLVAEKSATGPDLASRASQLEKTVLRSKLLLRQEERLLEEAKARSRSRPDVVSNGAKLEALTTTRTELINWIESELSNASGEEASIGPEAATGGSGDPEADQSAIQARLAEIKAKYARYLESRRDLLSLVSTRPQPSAIPDLKPSTTPQTTREAAPQPINHLLVPYIERLLLLSRSQKALITHKSHLSATLIKQTRDAYQGLGHLAEESQLLPAHPMKESLRRRSGLVEALTSKKSDVPDISNRVKPWVFASESAKIAGLESVAETIEGGQLALEGSMKALQELERLLGLNKSGETGETVGEESGVDDVWLVTENTNTGTRKHTDKQKMPERKAGDVWSILHGNLGLIGQLDAA